MSFPMGDFPGPTEIEKTKKKKRLVLVNNVVPRNLTIYAIKTLWCVWYEIRLDSCPTLPVCMVTSLFQSAGIATATLLAAEDRDDLQA